MRIQNQRSQAPQSATTNKASDAKQAKQESSKPKNARTAMQKQAADAADAFLEAKNSAMTKLIEPLRTGALAQAGDARHQGGQESLPNQHHTLETTPGSKTSLPDSVQEQIGGSQRDASYPLAEELKAGLDGGIDHDLIIAGKQTDGRHPDAPYVGAADLMQGNPYSGVGEEAAGKLPAHQQAWMEQIKANADAAAKRGDETAVNRWAEEAFKVTHGTDDTPTGGDPGTGDPGAMDPDGGPEATGTEENGWAEKAWNAVETGVKNAITGRYRTGGEPTPSEQMAESANDSLNETGKTEGEIGEAPRQEQAHKAADEVGMAPADGATGIVDAIKKKAGDQKPNEDCEEEYDAPDHWREFTDSYFEQKTGAERGGDIDYGPDGPPQSGESQVNTNSDSYTAEYGQEYRPPTEEEIAAGEARAKDNVDPDEEY